MPSTRSIIASAAHAFALLSLFTTATLADHQRLHKRGPTYVACYSSSTPLEQANTWSWQSQGYCSDHCDGGVIGLTNGDGCYCGNEIPANSNKVDDSKCDMICTGWPSVMCGGDGFWSVWLTGKGSNIQTYSDDEDDDSNGASSPSHSPTKLNVPTSPVALVVTSQMAGGSTVVVTVPASQPTDESQNKPSGGDGGGSNTAGIAAGVVVGVVALAAIVAAVYFYLRHRKAKQAEEEYKQRSQVAEFMHGTQERKAPGTGYSGMSDARLDPEVGHRNSVGSLADNQDYSRRILRVANPDDS